MYGGLPTVYSKLITEYERAFGGLPTVYSKLITEYERVCMVGVYLKLITEYERVCVVALRCFLLLSFFRYTKVHSLYNIVKPHIHYSTICLECVQMSPDDQKASSDACSKLRLMVSGSMALPTSVLHRWREITNHTLLERCAGKDFCILL